MNTLSLKRGEDRRILRGHPWIFSNELREVPKTLPPGEHVEILDASGKFIGCGYFNPHSLIAVRVLTWRREAIDRSFLRRRIAEAHNLRKALRFGDSFRAFFSEADGLPGLIVDKYADVLVVQSLTAGIDRMRDDIVEALREEYAPRAIVLRNDVASRALEGLDQETRVLFGEVTAPIRFEESGITWQADVLAGQKTGFFFDQRENRLALNGYVENQRTLDCFCYIGAWALSAARFGASEVIGLDASEQALQLARQNAQANGLAAEFRKADVFDELRALDRSRERFGCIILDPPAFVKNRSKVREALKGYKEINSRAMRLLEPNGLLVTCSCSHHVDQELFREMLIDSAASADKTAHLLEVRSQARDHPVLLAARETHYLKCFMLRIGKR